MKKITAYVLILMLAVILCAGCGTSGDGKAPSGSGASSEEIASWKTLGDLEEYEYYGYGYSSETYVKVFIQNGVFYRAIAKLPSDISDTLFELSYEDPDHDQKQDELLAPIELVKVENLSEQILPQEQLDQLVGKTGEELLNEGWTAYSSYNTETSEVYMDFGPFQYRITFEGTLDIQDDDVEAAIQSLKVKKAVFFNISSSATEVDE